MMNKISDLHEKFTPEREIEREGYVRKRFEVSGKGFEFTFSDKIVDLMEILKHCEREFYPTWQEASAAAQKLGINSWSQYCKRFSMDERLPCNPHRVYGDFPGMHEFFGKIKFSHYSTWQEASKAAIGLGIQTPKQYKQRRKEDPRLPSHPEATYKDFPSFSEFFGRSKREVYETVEEAAEAARKLGCKNWSEYELRYKEDPKLLREPWSRYGLKGFPWNTFLVSS
jgi:hypothetical protein